MKERERERRRGPPKAMLFPFDGSRALEEREGERKREKSEARWRGGGDQGHRKTLSERVSQVLCSTHAARRRSSDRDAPQPLFPLSLFPVLLDQVAGGVDFELLEKGKRKRFLSLSLFLFLSLPSFSSFSAAVAVALLSSPSPPMTCHFVFLGNTVFSG